VPLVAVQRSLNLMYNRLPAVKRQLIIIAVSSLICIGLVILGTQWSSWDHKMMAELDYRKNSQVIMRHDVVDWQEYLSGIRKMLASSGDYIVEDHKTGSNTWEIVGQSGRYWLTSSYLDKITVVDELIEPEDASETPQRQFVVYSISGESGSRAFLSIVVFCLMATVALSLRKDYLPHIYAENPPGRRRAGAPDTHRPDSRQVSSRTALPIVIFAVALILRLLFLAAMLTQIGAEHIIDQYPDSIKYVKAADYLFGRSGTGQWELYIVGSGYPFFVGTGTTIFGNVYWPILVIQIILSSLSCVLVYLIAQQLTGNRVIAVIAGFLSALSLTSISLANSILSETLFFFLLTLSLCLFFKGLKENRWLMIASGGAVGGLTVLVRSAAMLFPLIFIVLALIYPLAGPAVRRKQLVLKSVVAALIMIAIPASWGFRNLRIHDTFAISGTGVLAAKTYRHTQEFTTLRDSLYRASLSNFEAGTYRQDYAESRDLIISTFKKNPVLYIKKYLLTISDNVTATSGLHYIQLPQFAGFFETVDSEVNRGMNNPVALILALVGFVVLARKDLRIALLLLSIMAYFAALSGVTFGQGSRIFFPAQVAQSILMSASLLFLYDLLASGIKLLIRRR
jgi:4-amino-4-deoxy-L-arabinose transferase-like glycosyltransferase